jgi:two-component system response regulator HydG
LWENPFDAVILDIKLPDIDGVELLKNIRQADPVTGTLMLSGAATLEDAVESLNQGADAFMLKPVEPADLLYRLGKVTGFKRLERELREARARYNELFTIIHEE